MKLNMMSIGTKMELELINSLDQRIGQSYVSQLMDIVDQENIIIAAPIYETRLTLIPIGSRIRLIFHHNRYGLFNFVGIVSEREKRGNVFTFTVNVISPIEKIQRRMYFRLPCLINISYCLQNTSTEPDLLPQEDSIEPIWKEGIAKNISGNGICIVTNENLPNGTNLQIRFSLSAKVVISCTCKVMRSDKIADTKKSNKYELGLKFMVIDKKSQDAIVKFIFDEQKRQLRKKLDTKYGHV